MKLCVNCKHFVAQCNDREGQCDHETARKSPVDGSPDHSAYENRRYAKVHDEKSVKAMEEAEERRQERMKKYPDSAWMSRPGIIYVLYESCGMEAKFWETK